MERNNLGDPFFEIVLKNHADVVDLKGIETLLQPDPLRRRMFVVDENIARPDRMQSRRAVLDFLGRHAPTNIVLDGNVMLSVFFNSESFPDSTSEIEVWGWDAERGRYNYYKLDLRGTSDKKPAWKFRGSSVDADLFSADERNDTCLQCHINGAPIMKELLFPWNNWRSFKFPADYLKTNWPVGKSQRLQQLSGAEDLETTLLASIRQFNTRRLNAALARRPDNGDVMTDSSGNARMVDGVRMLKHLFVTTEVNLISSGQLSGLHPLDPNRPDSLTIQSIFRTASSSTQICWPAVASPLIRDWVSRRHEASVTFCGSGQPTMPAWFVIPRLV